MVLFLALMINATYLQYLQADDLTSLAKHPDNNRVEDAAFAEPRGKILVGDPAVALSRKSDDRYDFLRVYPGGAEYAHLAGYFTRNLDFGGDRVQPERRAHRRRPRPVREPGDRPARQRDARRAATSA